MSKVYLSGKIAGDPNYKEKFAHYMNLVAAKCHYTSIINPAILPETLESQDYMPLCLALLDRCDVIFMLPDWTNSKGSMLEKAYAEYQGKTVLYAEVLN